MEDLDREMNLLFMQLTTCNSYRYNYLRRKIKGCLDIVYSVRMQRNNVMIKQREEKLKKKPDEDEKSKYFSTKFAKL